MRYIYYDESVFAAPRESIGYGALESRNGINRGLIDQAIKDLSKDPDIMLPATRELDCRTLQRGWFHASQDSKNAHSSLCRTIANRVAGRFYCDFYEKTHPEYSTNSQEQLLKWASQLCSMRAINSCEPIVMVYEQREGLTVDVLRGWYLSLQQQLLSGMYDLPFIPTYFPACDYAIRDKSEPGLQCADFMLWSVNRQHCGNDVWLKRLNPHFMSATTPESQDWGSRSFILNGGVNDDKVFYSIEDFPKDPDDRVSSEMLIKFYLEGERIIFFFANNELPPHCSHFREELLAVNAGRMDPECPMRIETIASLFLRLFDMVPLIDATTSEGEKRYYLLSKKYLSLCLRKDKVHGVTTSDSLSRARRQILASDPKWLTF